jgi:Kef-type K+ transport system membrane component KefB
MVFGFGGGRLFRTMKIPQVVGYIVGGVMLGKSFLGLIDTGTIDKLAPLSNFALGLIGFMIGGELRFGIIKKLGKTIFAILLFESLGAFFLVSAGVYLVTHKPGLALVFGALSSATAPAATVDVLWEYKSKGILTSTLLAIVGLDDVVALIIYGFTVSFAKLILNGVPLSYVNMISKPLLEIGASTGIGLLIGLVLTYTLRKMRGEENRFILSVISILLCSGLADTFHLSHILASMALGITLTNLAPISGKHSFEILGRFVPPVYILFFVMIGARLNIWLLPKLGLIGCIYVLARSTGKIGGAFLGSRISNASESVRKYLGLCLFSQAGVTIGLAMAVYNEFSHYGTAGKELGVLIINVVTATTFIVQIIGPPSVKYAIHKAGEAGKMR